MRENGVPGKPRAQSLVTVPQAEKPKSASTDEIG